MNTLDIAAIVGCVLGALVVGFLIPVIIELRRTIAQASQFMQGTEKELATTLKEVEETLKSVRGITDGINQITGDVTSVSGGISGAAHDLKETTRHIEHMARSLGGHLTGVKAGLAAALGVIIKNLRGDRK